MELCLIYPHQLYARHPLCGLGHPIYLIEDPLYFGNDARWPCSMHQQKILLHRASMKAYAATLIARGETVHYIDAPEGTHHKSHTLLAEVLPQSLKKIHVVDPADEILSRRIEHFCRTQKCELHLIPSPNFLSPASFLEQTIASKKKPFMARFYEAQRKRMNVLLESDGTPVGGKWSFDEENRRKLPKNHQVAAEPWCAHKDLEEAIAYVTKRFSHYPGTLKGFRWPVTHQQAQLWLDRFIAERLHNFGEYEDAISTQHAYLYHAAITPALNIGLLDPQQVIDAVLQQKEQVPMNSLEGFIRQVIGWREFMRGIYQHHGRSIRVKNFWNFTRPMPQSFYDGTSGIAPVDRVIRQVLADGYCHHIERLMVLGNFFLLCRIHPEDVYRWFMELFVDAYDWVMVPNVYGMSQFADGGTFTTKPYLSGSNYVKKMSDEASGPWCEIWDALFWTFIADHNDFFYSNPRLSMMARTWEKMAPEKQAAHRKVASRFLEELS